jgi:Raf kinase inhibitor-like YbhB/YbcL family protein
MGNTTQITRRASDLLARCRVNFLTEFFRKFSRKPFRNLFRQILRKVFRNPQVPVGLGCLYSLLICAGLTACGSPDTDINPSNIPNTMNLQSAAFTHNGLIPTQYTCDGGDISPPLSWDDPPQNTQSFALIVDDPDAPGRTFVHWVMYNLPPDRRELPEGVNPGDNLGSNVQQGKSDFGRTGYGGPCPPSGTHRYFFKLYALDTMLELPTNARKPDLLQAMDGHILAGAELIGRYTRQR